ncbi:dienelactone hydrolase family protein [Shimazuella sp. AN120528]|uniref:dienelactone hydrolase family protein n=1 Tax=Shimazuella soli TaxID=1892854 RepID=UPI001F10C46A|nr:dienelactone hydrolase family protein [Shimazuella soli]MCH5584094.1 dienelactone hydrolase family protein [Shimazuella soli]
MKTAIICLHEIYGVNTFIQKAGQNLHHTFCLPVFTPSFLTNQQTYPYSEHDKAYSSFVNEVGFDQATERIDSFLHTLDEKYEQFLLWGYSIGATVGWRVSHRNKKVKGFVGFYGSRIRNYIEEVPGCPVLLIYPEKEQSFDVRKMSEQLMSLENIQINIVPASHGFADPYNPVYQEIEAKNQTDRAIEFFSELMGT